MTVKKLCWSVLTFLVVALMGMSFVSCGSDDEGDVSSLSETQIKSLLEAGSGQWTIRENDGEKMMERMCWSLCGCLKMVQLIAVD